MGGRSVRQNGALEGVGVVYLETPSIGGTRPHDPVGEGTPVLPRGGRHFWSPVSRYVAVWAFDRDVGVAIYWIVHDRLSFGCWGGCREGCGAGVRVLALGATDGFVSVDRGAFGAAGWGALDGAENRLFFTVLRGFPGQPACQQTKFRNQFRKVWSIVVVETCVLAVAGPAGGCLGVFARVFSLGRGGCVLGGVASCMKGKCIFL